jgi:hypothetical protein
MESGIRGAAGQRADGDRYTPMMDDHFIISRARNHLADALKALLNANIMDAADFTKSRIAALAAVSELDVLLREPNRNSA